METGPDFSSVTTKEAVDQLCQKGELEELLLLPRIFGGDENPHNVVFVPRGIGAVKHRIDAEVIAPMVQAGELTEHTARPEYQGASMVPTAVRITASGAGEFSETITVWGDALDG